MIQIEWNNLSASVYLSYANICTSATSWMSNVKVLNEPCVKFFLEDYTFIRNSFGSSIRLLKYRVYTPVIVCRMNDTKLIIK